MQDYPNRDALAAAMKLRMQQQSAPRKTSRLKRIILAERAEKAVAEATVSLQAAAQMTVTKMDHMRGLAEQLRVTPAIGPQQGCDSLDTWVLLPICTGQRVCLGSRAEPAHRAQAATRLPSGTGQALNTLPAYGCTEAVGLSEELRADAVRRAFHVCSAV